MKHKPTAMAWLRLAHGKGTAYDRFLLKHETVELFYDEMKKNNPKLFMEKFGDCSTHDVTNIVGYDYEKGFTIRGPRGEF